MDTVLVDVVYMYCVHFVFASSRACSVPLGYCAKGLGQAGGGIEMEEKEERERAEAKRGKIGQMPVALFPFHRGGVGARDLESNPWGERGRNEVYDEPLEG